MKFEWTGAILWLYCMTFAASLPELPTPYTPKVPWSSMGKVGTQNDHWLHSLQGKLQQLQPHPLAMGNIEQLIICCYIYCKIDPPDLLIVIMVHFDNLSGPGVHDGTIPYSLQYIRRSVFMFLLPLKMAWAETIHNLTTRYLQWTCSASPHNALHSSSIHSIHIVCMCLCQCVSACGVWLCVFVCLCIFDRGTIVCR